MRDANDDDDSAVLLTGEYGTAWVNTIPNNGLVPGQVFVRPSPDAGVAFRDPLESQKAACTAFVTRSCLRDPFPFMHLVVQRLTAALQAFAHAHVVPTPILAYKGGNVFLAIYRAFVQQFPEMARAPLLHDFASAFRYSDADFSVYFDPAHVTPALAQTLMDDVVATLQETRDALLHHAEAFFDFEQLRNDVQDEALGALLSELRALDPAVASVSFAGRTVGTALPVDATQWDMRIRFLDPQSEDWIIFEPELRQGRHILYAQDNRALHFPRAHQDIWFDLARLKFAFATRRNDKTVVRLNGELLDVSISRRTAEMQDVWRHRASWLVRYRIPYPDLSVSSSDDAARVLDVVGLSTEYLVKDLLRVLFADAAFPWEDKKYEKRIHRLLFLLFVETYVGTQQRGAVLRSVRHAMQRLRAMDVRSTEWQSVQSDLRLSSSPFLPFLDALHRVSERSTTNKNRASFVHLMDVCVHDMDVFLTVMARLGAYFDTNAAVPVARVYGR